MWVMGIFIFIIYSPLVWVRTVEFFAKGYILAMTCILASLVMTAVFALQEARENGGAGPDFVPIRSDTFWDMFGFAFFMFKGITALLPVVNESEKMEQMPFLTVAATSFLCVVHITFSTICYYAWGSDLNEPVVTQMLPAHNIFV